MKNYVYAYAPIVSTVVTVIFCNFLFDHIAFVEGIRDLRAEQVTLAMGCWLAFVSLVGGGYSFVRTVQTFGDPLKYFKHYVRGYVGLCVGTILSGCFMLGLAYFPEVIITPPQAWLAVLIFGIVSGIFSLRVFGD